MLWMKVPSKMGHCPQRNDTTTSAVTDPCTSSSHGTSIPAGIPTPLPGTAAAAGKSDRSSQRKTAAGRRKQTSNLLCLAANLVDPVKRASRHRCGWVPLHLTRLARHFFAAGPLDRPLTCRRSTDC